MQTMIQVRDLERTYQMGDIEVQALRGVSFDLHVGEFTAIMGPSGSGKSTLMNLLGCLDTPSAGNYTLNGLSVERLNKDELAAVRNRQIGFVFQQFHLLARHSALDNVELPLIYQGELSRAARRERAAAALTAVGLANRMDHRPKELSGGQQQRVAIARLVIDFVRYEARLHGALVRLTPKEFKLLETLAREPGRAFTRLELLDRVFGSDYEGIERTVDVHIMNLRKKLEADPTQPIYIQTVYGVGYKLAESHDNS